MKSSTSGARFGFSIVSLLFWLALVGFIIVGYILKNYKAWEAQDAKTSSDRLLKSKNLLDRTQGDQKLKKELINNTP